MTIVAVTWTLWGAFLAGGIVGMLITFTWVGVAMHAADNTTDPTPAEVAKARHPSTQQPPPPVDNPEGFDDIVVYGDWSSPEWFPDE